MRVNALLTAGLLFFTLAFFACRSVKPLQTAQSATQQAEQNLQICNVPIKYKVNKVKIFENQEEVQDEDAQFSFTIHPAEKLITLNDESSSKELHIESVDCSLNDKLTDGSAVYRLSLKNSTGNTSEQVMNFEAKPEGITVTISEKGEKVYFFQIDSCEIVKY